MPRLAFATPHVPRALFFFFNDTATTEIYTLSLHDALPISAPLRSMAPAISSKSASVSVSAAAPIQPSTCAGDRAPTDRKSTRLNSSHLVISYAVFCLKKKKVLYGCAPSASSDDKAIMRGPN